MTAISKTVRQALLAAMLSGLAITLTACGGQPTSDDAEPKAGQAPEPATEIPHGFTEIKQVAAQGDVEAQYQLGLWYEEDHPGSPRDMIRAYAWYKLAAEQGDFGAEYAMEHFEAELTPDERITADDLVDRWQPGDTLEK